MIRRQRGAVDRSVASAFSVINYCNLGWHVSHRVFIFAVFVALAPAGGARAQSDGALGDPFESSASWGGQLVPQVAPSQRSRAATPATPNRGDGYGGSTIEQAAPAYGSAYVQPQSPATGAPQGMSQVDAVYLDELNPAAPPDILTAGLTQQTLTPANQTSVDPQEALPPGAREGVFQKIYATGTWLPAMSDDLDALGFGELETGVVFGFPFFRRDTPLLVTPQFGVHFLENTDGLDVPDALYDAAVEFRHLRKFGGGPFAMDVAATVGYYSDFEQGSSDAVRVTGRGIAVYEAYPGTKWLLGAAYVNRAGASVLPIFGVIHEPRPDLRLELVFPRPRIAWQTAGSAPRDERWLYVAGEFGGGVWSVTRPSTDDLDLLNTSDWRLMVGYERKVLHGLTRRYEIGYVFNRELEYDGDPSEVALDDTIMARVGLTY